MIVIYFSMLLGDESVPLCKTCDASCYGRDKFLLTLEPPVALRRNTSMCRDLVGAPKKTKNKTKNKINKDAFDDRPPRIREEDFLSAARLILTLLALNFEKISHMDMRIC